MLQIKAKEQINLLLGLSNMKLKKVAEILTNRMQKKYTYGSLHNKITRGTLSYNEMLLIADILGFKITFDYKDEKTR